MPFFRYIVWARSMGDNATGRRPGVKESLGSSPKLSDIRLAASALLAFAAFLRFDELAKLRCWDITFTESAMSVHIASSKTDQYRQGHTVLVARTGNATCPVAMLELLQTSRCPPSSTSLGV